MMCSAAVLLAASQAQATGFAALLVPGIAGESVDPAFPGWIELTSLGLAGPLNTGPPGTLAVYKRIDKSSPLLARQCANGEPIKEAKLVIRRLAPSPGDPPVICVITMSDLLISSYSAVGDGTDGQQTETVQLRFSRIYFRYIDLDGSELTTSVSLGLGGVDSDGDGMPDAWETYYGLDPAVPNGKDDHDGDGLTDFQEFQLGTDPMSKGTRFSAAVVPVEGASDSIDIAWDSVPGVAYVIEWSPDLAKGFVPLAGIRVADGSVTTARLTKSGPTGFFRVRPAGP